MYCDSCGFQVNGQAAKCPSCGAAMRNGVTDNNQGAAPTSNYTIGDTPVSFGNWLGSMLLLCIPVVNIIMASVWAVSAESESKKNFFRAWFAMIGIAVVVGLISLMIRG